MNITDISNTGRINKWDELSMKEKAAIMRVAVSNGIYKLDDIRQKYNEFAEGGPEESTVYTPPRYVLDNIAKNKKYVMAENPPLVGVGSTVAKVAHKTASLYENALNGLYDITERLGSGIVSKVAPRYKDAVQSLYMAIKQNAIGTTPKEGSDFGARLPAFLNRISDSANREKAYGGPLVGLANKYYGGGDTSRPRYIYEETDTTPVAGYTAYGNPVVAANLGDKYLDLELPEVNVGLDKYNVNEKINQAQEKAGKIGTAAMAVGLAPYLIGTAAPYTPYITKGLDAAVKVMNPSSYTGIFGTGAYNTALGGTGTSLAGVLADNILASYYGAEAGKSLIDNWNTNDVLGNSANAIYASLATLPMVSISKDSKLLKQIASGTAQSKIDVPEGWEIIKPLTLNGRQTYQVKHPKYGFSTLEEANGSYGRGKYAQLVTNEALDAYNPMLRADSENKDFIDELRYIARRIDSGKESPAIIQNTDEYHLYPKLWDVVLKTERGREAYPNGATMVGRGIWPGSSNIIESSNYPSLFLGYNRDMGMPYSRIGTFLGQNNIVSPKYEKYFSKETVDKLRKIDSDLASYLDSSGHYSPEYSNEIYKLHHQRNLLLGNKVPEFGGYQQILIPNSSKGEMLGVVRTSGLQSGDKWENMRVTVPKLSGDDFYTDPDLIAKALAEQGQSLGINGVHVTNIDPLFGGFHDKGVGTEVIWGQHGTAPYLKSVYGNSFKNLLGTVESAYKKGGKLRKKH